MSRTFRTDPYIIRALRSEGRPVTVAEIARWDHRNAPPGLWSRNPDPEAWLAWQENRPRLRPGHRGYGQAHYAGAAENRTLAQRTYRAHVQECIDRGDFDGISDPRRTKGWYDWRW